MSINDMPTSREISKVAILNRLLSNMSLMKEIVYT